MVNKLTGLPVQEGGGINEHITYIQGGELISPTGWAVGKTFLRPPVSWSLHGSGKVGVRR